MTPVSTNATMRLPGWVSGLYGWLPTPHGASAAGRRFYSFWRVGYPGGALSLATFIVVFSWWSVWPVALASLLGLAVWLGAAVLARRGWQTVSSWLAIAQVAAHASLVVVFVGWGFGAQYALLIMSGTPHLLECGVGSRLRWSWSALMGIAFVSLYYYTEAIPPPYEVPASQLVLMNVVTVALVIAVSVSTVSYSVSAADQAEDALAVEHARSERLLTNVLPVPIAERLKEHEEVIADGVDGASVLFADIVGFTVLSAQRTPDEIVAMLNGVFTRLDALVDEFGLEKIKTIGDAYMVASGIPVPREDHAQVLARFALAARDELAEHNLTADVPVELRIGINSGPVVAGVIGRRRFLYDLWGDTVNTAARMESHGLPGQIQIARSTRALLDGGFTCSERGVIDVKGKGPTRTWLLEGEVVAVPT